jgi:hypothetical protein
MSQIVGKNAIADVQDDSDHEGDEHKLNQYAEEIYLGILKCIDEGSRVEDQRDHHGEGQ